MFWYLLNDALSQHSIIRAYGIAFSAGNRSTFCIKITSKTFFCYAIYSSPEILIEIEVHHNTEIAWHKETEPYIYITHVYMHEYWPICAWRESLFCFCVKSRWKFGEMRFIAGELISYVYALRHKSKSPLYAGGHIEGKCKTVHRCSHDEFCFGQMLNNISLQKVTG